MRDTPHHWIKLPTLYKPTSKSRDQVRKWSESMHAIGVFTSHHITRSRRKWYGRRTWRQSLFLISFYTHSRDYCSSLENCTILVFSFPHWYNSGSRISGSVSGTFAYNIRNKNNIFNLKLFRIENRVQKKNTTTWFCDTSEQAVGSTISLPSPWIRK